MNVTTDLSFTHLVLQASVPVQLIMLILALLSVMSWYWIFRKIFQIRDARRRTDAFEASFWQGSDLDTLARLTESRLQHAGPMELVFLAAWREFLRQRSRSLDSAAALESVRRAMRAAYQREMDSLESHLNFLASAGSVSPYIGLLGTVWGIMHAFIGLSNMQQATLAAVAPGIAEALIATAIGLFAAIPAVVAYNRFTNDIDRISIRFDSFVDEFLNILQRQVR